VEGPKDEYYSSLNTFDHDSALGGYPQLEVLPGVRDLHVTIREFSFFVAYNLA
jgi:hypothetical protein